MSRRATFAALAALAAALPCAALPLGLRLTQAAVTQAASAKEKDPLLMTEEEAYAAYAPDTAWLFCVTNNTQVDINVLHSRGERTVDWGDGMVEPITQMKITHVYKSDGNFVVRISDTFSRVWEAATPRKLKFRVLRWGDSITDLGWSCYSCKYLFGPMPRWPARVKRISSAYDMSATYSYNTTLVGAIPPIPETVVGSANYTFSGCSGLTGQVPAWGAAITSANYTFWGCSGLTGQVPQDWKNVTSANSTFSGCSGLTGDIPAWGAAVKNVAYCYYNCKGLTGAWTDDPAELMPTNITPHGNCVSYTSATLQALFYSDWGGSKPKPTE